MKNKLKYILLALVIVFLTGCSGNYNLKINTDLSIDESLELSIENQNDAYNKTLNIFEENKIDKKNYDVNINGNNVIIKYKESYVSIEDYILNSKVYPQLFDEIEYNKSKNSIDLSVDENLKIRNRYNLYNGNNLTDLDVIQINVQTPFKMIYSNEEMKVDDTYTWSIKNTDTKKYIKMNFKQSFDKVPYKPIIIGSLMLILTLIFAFRTLKKYMNFQRI